MAAVDASTSGPSICPARRFTASNTLAVPSDVDVGAARRVGAAERELQGCQVDDARDAVAVEHRLQRRRGRRCRPSRASPARPRRAPSIEVEPRGVGAEVEADHVDALAHERRRRPGADAAEDAGDEDAARSSELPRQIASCVDGVAQLADAGDAHDRPHARRERHVVRRHDARPRVEDAAGRHGVVAQQPVDELAQRRASSSPCWSTSRSPSSRPRRRCVSSIANGASRSSGTSTAGPSEPAAANSLACGRYSGFAPSTSRAVTSLPAVTPTMPPPRPSTSTSSGSGTVQRRVRAHAERLPGPTVRRQAASFMKISGRSASYTIA